MQQRKAAAADVASAVEGELHAAAVEVDRQDHVDDADDVEVAGLKERLFELTVARPTPPLIPVLLALPQSRPVLQVANLKVKFTGGGDASIGAKDANIQHCAERANFARYPEDGGRAKAAGGVGFSKKSVHEKRHECLSAH